MWPAVPTIMASRSCVQLLGKGRFVARFQAAQVEPQRLVGDAADHRPRQGAQRRFEPLELAAGAPGLARRQAQAGAGQGVDGQGTAADLAGHGGHGHLDVDALHVLHGLLQRRPQPLGLRLHLRLRADEQAQRRSGARPDARACGTDAAPASSAASVSLPTRSARLSGFFLILAIRSLRPTIRPACGPPSSLSPLKVTRSAPAAIVSRTVASCGRPHWRRSTSVPLPRSTDQRQAARVGDGGQLRPSGTALVKPATA